MEVLRDGGVRGAHPKPETLRSLYGPVGCLSPERLGYRQLKKKRRHSGEVTARGRALRDARRIHSLHLLYGEGFLSGVCAGAPPDHEIQFYGSKKAADDQYVAGFRDGREIRKARQAAARAR